MSQIVKSPVPEVEGPLGNGKGWPFGAPTEDLAARGYLMEEFILRGRANSYRPRPGAAPGPDGVWLTEPGEAADYVTRMYVVRPADPADFNGVAVLNWQNVTASIDLGFPGDEEIFRGYAWVGVTTQKLGVDGVSGVTQGLTAWDPERYGALRHPGDAFSFDIYGQAGRLLKAGPRDGEPDPLGGLRPATLIGLGASQSAMRLGSYINAAHQHDRVFDGFYLVVHWGLCPPIEDISLQQQFARRPGGTYAATSRINDRGDTPVLVVATECEALHNFPVRQPDSDSYRFWEIAGAAHTDVSQSEAMTAIMRRDGIDNPFEAPSLRNCVPWSYVKDAGLRWLVRWIVDKTPPPRFPPIEIQPASDGKPVVQRDRVGNARGGLRLPDIVAATGVHLGTNKLDPRLALSGESRLFDRAGLESVHGGRDAFLRVWAQAVDELVAANLALPSEAERLHERAAEIWPQPASTLHRPPDAA